MKEYSDLEGVIELDKKQFQLPSEDWEWIQDWTPEVHPNYTDEQGWQYSDDFHR